MPITTLNPNQHKGNQMKFIPAIQHATIGYGIRRKCWAGDTCLHLDNLQTLRWIGVNLSEYGRDSDECKFFGGDAGFDLSKTDILADDWETV